jgi:hypothetical protein
VSTLQLVTRDVLLFQDSPVRQELQVQLMSIDKHEFSTTLLHHLLVVTLEKAALWTDGRYYLQASQQLSSSWILQKAGLPGTPSQEDWLV